MDAVTLAALSIQNPLLSAAGHLFDHDLVYVAIVSVLLMLGEWKNDKRAKIFASIFLAVIMGMAIKVIVAEPRPCAGLDWCPTDYSFPSLHAVIAFTLMSGFIRKRSFPFYLLFALFVSFTRMNIGVHTFTDICGALPVALIAYYLTDLAYVRAKAVWKERFPQKKGGPEKGDNNGP